MTDDKEFEKWFDEAGWKTGLSAKQLFPIWKNVRTWLAHQPEPKALVAEIDEITETTGSLYLALQEFNKKLFVDKFKKERS